MEKEIKLIALDLDGTLFDEQKCISEENRNAIREASRLGVQTVISTGRPCMGLPTKEMEETGIRYAITANGAALYSMPEKECLYSDCLDWETSCALLENLGRLDIRIDIFVRGQGYSEYRYGHDIDRMSLPQSMKQYLSTTRRNVESLPEYVREHRAQVEKFTLNFYPRQDGTYGDYDRAVQLLSGNESLTVVSGGYHNLEISSRNATKGKGLCILARMLGIDPGQTMACGDSENDIDILETAGIGVAMGNADDSVKRIADYVTRSNEENGVAHAIRELVLNQKI